MTTTIEGGTAATQEVEENKRKQGPSIQDQWHCKCTAQEGIFCVACTDGQHCGDREHGCYMG